MPFVQTTNLVPLTRASWLAPAHLRWDLPHRPFPWSTQSCAPHRHFSWSKPPGLPCRRSRRQSNTISSVTDVPTPSAAKTGGVARRTARSTSTCRHPRGTRRSCGAWPPLPTALPSTQTLPPWSMPPGLPCRQFSWSKPPGLPCRQSCRRLASHLLSSPAVGHAALVGQASRPAAGVRAGLGALYPPPSLPPNCVPRRGGPACPPPVEQIGNPVRF